MLIFAICSKTFYCTILCSNSYCIDWKYWIRNSKSLCFVRPSEGIFTCYISSNFSVIITIGTCKYSRIVCASNGLTIAEPRTTNDHLELISCSSKISFECCGQRVCRHGEFIFFLIPRVHTTCDNNGRDNYSSLLERSSSSEFLIGNIQYEGYIIDTTGRDSEFLVAILWNTHSPSVILSRFILIATSSEGNTFLLEKVCTISLFGHSILSSVEIPIFAHKTFCTYDVPCFRKWSSELSLSIFFGQPAKINNVVLTSSPSQITSFSLTISFIKFHTAKSGSFFNSIRIHVITSNLILLFSHCLAWPSTNFWTPCIDIYRSPIFHINKIYRLIFNRSS